MKIFSNLSFQEKGRIRAVDRSFHRIAGIALWKPSWWTLFLNQAELDHFLKVCHTYIHKHCSVAVHMLYETVLAEKVKPNSNPIKVLNILTKEKHTRNIKSLIEAGLIDESEFKKVNLNTKKLNYLCTDQVIVALFQNLRADYKDLNLLPDYLIKNLLNSHNKEIIKDYIGNLILQSINELNNSEISRESVLNKCFTYRKKAIQNPWLMQICTANWYIPIHLVILQNDIDLMHFLIKHSANTEYKDINGNSLLDIAERYHRYEILNLLQKAHTLAQQETQKFIAKNLEIKNTANQLNDTYIASSIEMENYFKLG